MTAKGGRKAHAGFRSKAQWRMFFANPRLRKYAKKWAHETPGGPKVRYHRLPARKGRPTATTLKKRR